MAQTAKVIEMEPKAGALVEYGITEADITALKKKVFAIEITDSATYDTVRKGLSTAVSWRTAIETRRKDRNREFVQGNNEQANRLLGMISPIEDNLRDKKKVVDDKKEAAKAEKARVEAERVEGIRAKVYSIQQITVGLTGLTVEELTALAMEISTLEIVPEEYVEFTLEAKQARSDTVNAVTAALEARIQLEEAEAARKAEDARLEQVRLEQEAEAKRLKAENARLETIRRSEEARLAEAQAKADAEQKAHREWMAEERRKLEDETAALEAEKKAERDRKDREALEKKMAEEAKVKAEQDAKDKVEREEVERLAKAKAEEEEKARNEALIPDKVRLLNFASELADVVPGALKDQAAKEIGDLAVSTIYGVVTMIRNRVEKL